MSQILKARFKSLDKHFLKFGDIPNKLSSRPDIHAFIILNNLVPSSSDIIDASEHDVVFLNIDCDVLEQRLSDEDLTDLIRCGVHYHTDTDCLAMFT
jgi:hypothetical protein